ncbi:hypothetical protein V8G54_033666 [Vigna mungo]|uniref:Uncharacterized protein n=1 Tax=Vigna mungo TaxID=3915 RepID=A0AAQ3RGJ3_VIGMU
MAVPVGLSDRYSLVKSVSISLNDKVVSQYATPLAPLAVDAVKDNDYTTKRKLDEEQHDGRQILAFIEGGAIPALVKHLPVLPLINRVQKPLPFKHERRRRFGTDRVAAKLRIFE